MMNSMLRRTDLAWAAGLFDGEGSIAVNRKTPVAMRLGMCDERTVRRYARITGATVNGPYKTNAGTLYWSADLGTKSACAALQQLLPFLTTKRRKAALAIRIGRTVGPQGPRTSQRTKTRRAKLVKQFKETING